MFDTVVLGGGTAGTLDILDAIVMTAVNGGAPTRMLQSIASGVLGRAAYDGGTASAALGLALHFLIACSAAAAYLVASRKLPVLLRRPVPCGIAFGVVVWAFMYFVVLPVTFHRMTVIPAWPQLANQLGIHTLGVGLPIAFFASRSSSNVR